MDSGAIAFFAGFVFTIGFVVVLIELVVMCVASLFSRKERNMFADQIKAGAKLLDEKVPEWMQAIDLEKLYLGDPCNCVVGQACPTTEYADALRHLFDMPDVDENDVINFSCNYGFCIDDNDRSYPELTEEWKSYIIDRRTKQLDTIGQVP